MKWINRGILVLMGLAASAALAEMPAQSITVDCNNR